MKQLHRTERLADLARLIIKIQRTESGNEVMFYPGEGVGGVVHRRVLGAVVSF
jgi:hypothetical protein